MTSLLRPGRVCSFYLAAKVNVFVVVRVSNPMSIGCVVCDIVWCVCVCGVFLILLRGVLTLSNCAMMFEL